ncbi:hypothetical protein PIROE2DRAFT_17072 [Piromyces sp. E2]|nr:hypothetical protein PIROE2DRAFT_17072 [Piromyces sp. E2]|eukprot:OUM57829.1 hypothetical protein PIROE2DRAFT_17072 [Piromyces sp. E2]
MTFTQNQEDTIQIFITIGSVLSFIGSSAIIISTLYSKNLFGKNKLWNRIIFYMSFWDMCGSFALIIRKLFLTWGDESCRIHGLALQFFFVSSILWTTAIAVNIYLVAVLKKDIKDIERKRRRKNNNHNNYDEMNSSHKSVVKRIWGTINRIQIIADVKHPIFILYLLHAVKHIIIVKKKSYHQKREIKNNKSKSSTHHHYYEKSIDVIKLEKSLTDSLLSCDSKNHSDTFIYHFYTPPSSQISSYNEDNYRENITENKSGKSQQINFINITHHSNLNTNHGTTNSTIYLY